MGQYSLGTVTVTNASATVAGVSTVWIGNINIGDLFKVKGEDALYNIGAVTDNTTLSLTSVYAGTTKASQNYQITVDFTPNMEIPEIWAGDIDWPYHLTQGLRIIDAGRVRKTTDSTATTTALIDVAGLSFSVKANMTYMFKFLVIFQTALTTTGINLAVNGPASPTRVVYNIQTPTSTTAVTNSINRAYDAGTATTGIDTSSVDTLAIIDGVLVNGTTAGTLIVRVASEVAGSVVKIKAGSCGMLHPFA